jgi:repressor LexA
MALKARTHDLQERIYTFLATYQREHGRPPTNREIGKEVGIMSTNHIAYHLAQLEHKGRITRHPYMSRGIEITEPPHGVPICGRIAAGEPLEIFSQADEYLDIPSNARAFSQVYALQVVGSSMIEEHICDGDYVLVQPQKTCENGDVVVAVHMLAGQRASATLKRCYQERAQHRVRLQPANGEMQPLLIPEQEWKEEWEIQGKVVAVYRLYESSAITPTSVFH